MRQYVNEQAFFDWYARTAKNKTFDRSRLLEEAFEQYQETRVGEFVLSPSQTESGRREVYPFRFENLGCCGASTIFLYF